MGLPWLDVDRLSIAATADALETALKAGLDPESGPPRVGLDVAGGQMLVMPAAVGNHAGVKIVTIAPDRLPRIQGVYLLFDAATLAPVALIDGAALTSVRTPAVSLLAIRRLTPDRPLRTVLFGTGPQAWGHARALDNVDTLTVVGRDPDRTEAFVDRCRSAGLAAVTGTPKSVSDADLVLCCTTARTPLFDGDTPPDTACVVAIGTHEPDAREVDAAFVARAALYVEARTAAGREAGELVSVAPDRLVNLAELLTAPVDLTRPRLFKSVGMAWEDLVVAAARYAYS